MSRNYSSGSRRYEARTPRHACPTCKRPNVLTDYEAARKYQCVDCTRRDAADFGGDA